MERLLLPLVVDDDEFSTLMADPAGKHWEDVELELRLRQRLPKSYDVFLEIIGNISGLVDSLKKELVVKGRFQVLVTKVFLRLSDLEPRSWVVAYKLVGWQAGDIQRFAERSSEHVQHRISSEAY